MAPSSPVPRYPTELHPRGFVIATPSETNQAEASPALKYVYPVADGFWSVCHWNSEWHTGRWEHRHRVGPIYANHLRKLAIPRHQAQAVFDGMTPET